jgi:hypothetical protein
MFFQGTSTIIVQTILDLIITKSQHPDQASLLHYCCAANNADWYFSKERPNRDRRLSFVTSLFGQFPRSFSSPSIARLLVTADFPALHRTSAMGYL